MTTYGPFTDAVPRTLVRSQQANQIVDLLQSATEGTVLMGVGVGVVQMGPLDAAVLDGAYEQGEDVTAFVTGAEGVVLNASIGTAAAPSHALGATLKASRTSVATQAELEAWTGNPGYDGCDGQAAILGVASGPHPTETQPVGVMGYAKNNSHATLGNRDAVGLYGVGQVEAQGVGTGIGAFILGSTLGPQGTPVGAEIDISNAGSPIAYSPTAFSGGYGIWMNPSGAECAAGIAINNSFGAQFEVGFAVVGGTAGGKTGGARAASFRDDGNATTSYDMRGSHAIGIDTINAICSVAPVRMGHNQMIRARNAANGADWGLVGLLSDTTSLGREAPNLTLNTGNALQWQVDATGHLLPGSSNTRDIGSLTLRPRQVFVGYRLLGDFSDATVTNRAYVVSTVVNGETALGLLPNGTSQQSMVRLHNAADPTNASVAQFFVTNGVVGVDAARLGSGPFLPMALYTSGAPRISIQTNGDLQLGGGAVAVGATAPFVYIGTAPGTPTGVPTGYAGMVPLVYDSAANKLWCRNGSTWRSVTFT